MIIQPKVPDAKLLEYIYDAAEKYKEIMEQPFLYTEIKNRLFDELYCDFPEELKNLIDMK